MPIVTLLIQEPIVRKITGNDLDVSTFRGNGDSISLYGFVYGPSPKPIPLGGEYNVNLIKVEEIEREMELYTVVTNSLEKIITGYQIGFVDNKTHHRIYRTKKNQEIITLCGNSETIKLVPYKTSKVYKLSLEIIYPNLNDQGDWITIAIVCNKSALVAIATYDSDGINPFPATMHTVIKNIEGIKSPHSLRKKIKLMQVYNYKNTLYIEKTIGRVEKVVTTECVTRWCYYYYRNNELTYQTMNPIIFSDYDSGFEKVGDGTFIHINSDGVIKPLYIAKKSKTYVWMDLTVSFDLPFLSEKVKVYTFILDKSGEAIPFSEDISS